MTPHNVIRYGSIVALGLSGLWSLDWLLSPSEATLVAEGRELFLHEWVPDDELAGAGDGLGPVFNEKSCVACHFQGGIGGGGDVPQNVNAFQVLPNRNDKSFHGGVIHAYATAKRAEETCETVRRLFPAIAESTRVVGGCTVRLKGFDPLIVESINTPALYGVGLIDEISGFAIRNARRGRELARVKADFNLKFDRTSAGKLQQHGLSGVGKFGWRGQFSTLEEFVATACAVELGLTNSVRAQDVPREHRPDPDAEYDMTSRQLDALVTYCRSLPRPEQVLPADAEARSRVHDGEKVFISVGCADCHVPDIGGVTGVYSDFLLYELESSSSGEGGGYIEELEVPLPSNVPHPDEWQTPPLWGVADSAPYFHDGGSATLVQAIMRHSGKARHVMKKYNRLNAEGQRNLILFLESLKAPVDAEPCGG